MNAILLDGKSLAQRIKEELKNKIHTQNLEGHRPPSLAVVLVGNLAASEIYVRNKHQACNTVGIHSNIIQKSSDTTETELLDLIHQLNQDQTLDGILVQLPLPAHINKYRVLEALDPYKDVDGLHPYNLGLLAQGRPLFRACTPYGVMRLLETPLNSKDCATDTLVGQHAVMVGASDIVGKPMALELLQAGCTITVCHQYTRHLAQHVQQADLLISAIGKPGIIQSDWIKPGAFVIDVGINRLANNTIIGDIHFDTAVLRAGAITPVPGGVGPMTVAMLLTNTCLSQQLRVKSGL